MHFKKTLVSCLTFGSLLCCFSPAWGQAYRVQPGDSLYTIATRYGTTVAALQQANGLKNAAIYPGQALNIGYSSSTSGSSVSYTVRPGDTLYLLAQKYGVTVTSLKQANNISSSYLTVGQRLLIPTSAGGGSAPTDSKAYTVKSGDSLYLIAQSYGVTTAALCQANNISTAATLYPGQQLKIPTSSTGSSTSNYYGFKLTLGDLDLLARLVSAESDGEPFNGQVAVAATILNRLRDPRYPKTVSGVVYQIDYGRYQYSPVLDGRINLPASPAATRAVQSAITGWDPSNGANGFYNPAKTTSDWVRSNPETARIGNHVFFSY